MKLQRQATAKILLALSIGLVVLGAVLAACSSPSNGDPGTPSTTPSLSAEPASLLPFPGEPPIWPLSIEETDQIVGGLSSLYFPGWSRPYGAVTTRCRSLKGTRPEGNLVGGNAAVEACLRPYLEDLKVGRAALDLFFETGIAIWGSEPTGPFWLAEGFDYDMYGTNGLPPEYLFSSRGVFDVPGQITNFSPPEGWPSLLDATDVAVSTPPMPHIRDAYADLFDMRPTEVGFWSYGEVIDLLPARRTDSGWAIPLTWELRGCHACTTPIYGRFELESDAAGQILGVHFVDACFDPSRAPDDLGDLGSKDFGLVAC